MKATGIIRRIDELGRIVIPKEIRKNLRIKEGENIEIYLSENDKIILKKYSIMKKINDIAQNLTDVINLFLKRNIIITDTNTIVAISGQLKKSNFDKNLTEEIMKKINDRTKLLERKQKINLTQNLVIEPPYIINPILLNGDIIGLILLETTDKSIEIDEKISNITSKFLEKYLEE